MLENQYCISKNFKRDLPLARIFKSHILRALSMLRYIYIYTYIYTRARARTHISPTLLYPRPSARQLLLPLTSFPFLSLPSLFLSFFFSFLSFRLGEQFHKRPLDALTERSLRIAKEKRLSRSQLLAVIIFRTLT
jgi:hypothetical protein